MQAGCEGEPARRTRAVLEAIVAAAGVDAEVRLEEAAHAIVAELVGVDVGPLVGHHGRTIDAIEHLAQRTTFRGLGDRKVVTVDAAGYRARQAATLHAIAGQAADTAVKERRLVALEPMGAHERRVVHEHLKGRFDVETYSEGQEPARRVMVAPLTA